jgi:hypothetical protein
VNTLISILAEEQVRTVVLDGLSWRDIAVGAALALVLVLVFIALAVLRTKNRARDDSFRTKGVISHNEPIVTADRTKKEKGANESSVLAVATKRRADVRRRRT